MICVTIVIHISLQKITLTGNLLSSLYSFGKQKIIRKENRNLLFVMAAISSWVGLRKRGKSLRIISVKNKQKQPPVVL